MRIVHLMQGAATLPALSSALRGTEVFQNFWIEAFVDPQDFDYAIIMLRMPGDTWFGLGLGTRDMSVDSDMIQVDGGRRLAFDMVSVGRRQPEIDTQQDLEA